MIDDIQRVLIFDFKRRLEKTADDRTYISVNKSNTRVNLGRYSIMLITPRSVVNDQPRDNQQLVSYFVTIPVNGANERQTGYRVSLEKPGHLCGERCSIEKQDQQAPESLNYGKGGVQRIH
ncbi:hypothetical protein BHYA_0032g00210 [Botrytis hyacinthi]|uniref:Uncharacterized protein n=1 Tax=Botrytis hyacinthi TaxID=278943 RepID=A0A4Z1GZB9_9HELO|nr:hypothetical protein BHYA_0032g00210 [Botrytis hyacinthi]